MLTGVQNMTAYLTLTRVVFELVSPLVGAGVATHLTLTRVVFEFPVLVVFSPICEI